MNHELIGINKWNDNKCVEIERTGHTKTKSNTVKVKEVFEIKKKKLLEFESSYSRFKDKFYNL